MTHQHATLEDTVYFWFAANDTAGSGNDGASAAADVRLAGAAASAAPVLSPTPALLSDAGYPAGCYEVAVAATAANGFAAGNVYAVFCTLAVDSQNPSGFVGSFNLTPIIANTTQISGDATAADNLEATFDGTGYTDDEAPAKQSQLASLTSVGAAINTPAESYVLTTGVQSSGTYASTAALDGVLHQHTDTAGALELYYQFDVGADGIPVSVTLTGRINGVGDDLTGVYAYNWDGTSWDKIGDLLGQASTTNITQNYNLYTSHVGTGANSGKVRIRFYAASGLTSATLSVDQLFTSYAVVYRSVGYSEGAIWIDTNGSNTNTTSYIDGTADNPVSTWAAALTLSSQLGIIKFRIINGSTITLSGASDYYTLAGDNWTLALNGQSITRLHVTGASVSGTGTGTNPQFHDCELAIGGTLTVPGGSFIDCAIAGSIVFTGATTYYFDNCYSGIAGTSTPDIDFGAAVGNTALNMRHYSGGIEIKNMGGTGTDTMSLEGMGQLVINANCSGGTVVIRGMFTVTDNAGGALTLSDAARYDIVQINDQVVDVFTIDTFAEPASVPAATATFEDMIHWLYTISRNKATQTVTTKTIRNDGDSGDIGSAAVSDIAGTFTRGKYT